MEKKRGLFSLILILILPLTFAYWNPDLNGDNCVDQTDLDFIIRYNNSLHNDQYDVDMNGIIDDQDAIKIRYYLSLAAFSPGCKGFFCKAEECNGIDDNCDGVPDNSEGLCPTGEVCVKGECIYSISTCFDTDGRNIFEKGDAHGISLAGVKIIDEERCMEKTIYGETVEASQCYGDNCYLTEFYCSEDLKTLFETPVRCEYGCRLGSCIDIKKKCHEYDNGLDILKASQGGLENKDGTLMKLYDSCLDKNTLVEYVCNDRYIPETSTLIENYTIYQISCDCMDGKCINLFNGTCIDTDFDNIYKRGFTFGITHELTEIADFDYCMLKNGTKYAKTYNCQGDLCYVLEYGCGSTSKVTKYIKSCRLGCINGLCSGKECSKNEFFIINQKGGFTYDDECRLKLAPTKDISDEPSATFLKLDDYSCCSGSSKSFCVYNGKCYQHSSNSNYYEIEGENVACGCMDSSCEFTDGNHAGEWFDLDNSRDICEGGKENSCNVYWYPKTNFVWTTPGEQRKMEENIWEFESNDVECCGDDSGEFPACDGKKCICCGSKTDAYENGKCAPGKDVPLETPKQSETPSFCLSEFGEKDSDCDKLPDAWEEQWGLNPSAKDANLDNDEDGIDNYREYILKTDPTTPNEAPKENPMMIGIILISVIVVLALFGILYYFFVLNYQNEKIIAKKEIKEEPHEEGGEEKLSHETTHMSHDELKEHLDLLQSIEGQKKRELKKKLEEIDEMAKKKKL